MSTRLSKTKDQPCPFCKSTELFLDLTETTPIWFFVTCGECGATGPTDLGQSGAIEAWNTRKYLDPFEVLFEDK